MLRKLCAVLLVLVPEIALGHALPTPAPRGVLRVRGAQLFDESGTAIVLRGTQISGLNAANPTAADLENVAALNATTFGVIRERWNMNAVRLPVSVWIWQRDGQAYLDRVARIVRAANDAELLVVIAAFGDTRAGAPVDTGLPGPEAVTFWRAWAAFFKDKPLVIFDIYNEPSARNIPGHIDGRHSSEDWRFWLRGGVIASGARAAGMQDLVDAIRAAGATQIVAVPAFHDAVFEASSLSSTYAIRT